MHRIVLAVALTAVFAASARWTLAQQPAQQPLFTGTSTAMDGKDLSVARRSFEKGARTYWHSHSNGQLLMVEKGSMRLQKRGERMKELIEGGADYTAPNVVHWHGATPGKELVQINVGFGGETKWLEAVTEAQYSGK